MTALTIPKPDPDREPQKVNIYRFVQNTPTALAPLFPYLDEGSIVPCASTFRGGPGRDYGRFQHFNTVDEVVVVFGAAGGERRAPGLVRVGAKLHTVVSPMGESDDPDIVRVIVITQRQSIGKEQREEVRFICEKCDRRLFIHGFDATPAKRGTKMPPGSAGFHTIGETYEAARRFNEDEAARLCKHCGHRNPPFPIEAWAWNVYVDQTEIAQKGVDSMVAAPNAGPPPGARPGGH